MLKLRLFTIYNKTVQIGITPKLPANLLHRDYGRLLIRGAVHLPQGGAARSLPAACFSTSSLRNQDLITELQRSDAKLRAQYDCVIIGAGHNGLTAATYLRKAGLSVCVLEKRHTIGGAAVTEEIIPGFKFSRLSYVLSLLRPEVFNDLELKKHGLKLYFRNPNSYTPMLESPGPNGCPRSLTLGGNKDENAQQIAQFSGKDAKAYSEYERQLDCIVRAIDPLLDVSPVHMPTWSPEGSIKQKRQNWPSMKALLTTAKRLRPIVPLFYDMMTAPAATVLNKWFESEPLKATLSTDSVIGAMISHETPGSGYVLLHHVMGELEGQKGAWAYVEGGMGAVSLAMARAAREAGVEIFTNKGISEIIVTDEHQVEGVVTTDGTAISAKMVLSNATPHVTFIELVKQKHLTEEFVKDVSHIDYTSPVTKINIAVDRLPNFLANPNTRDGVPLPHHRTTIHLNCEHMGLIHQAYLDAEAGMYSKKPVIEMTIPSSLDPTLAPSGQHVVQLFTQYTPFTLAGGQTWTDDMKKKYTDTVFGDIEKYAPGFRDSIVGVDILTPPDLEREFGLTGGNIFHGSMSLHQLYFQRPVPAYSDTRSPVRGLYLCGSGAHPGGGVMGSPGRLAALTVIQDWKQRSNK